MCLWMGGLSRCFLSFDVIHHANNAFVYISVNHDVDLSSDDISTTTAKSQTTWSGVVELTESYTMATDELIIAPCTLVKVPNSARIFVDGRRNRG